MKDVYCIRDDFENWRRLKVEKNSKARKLLIFSLTCKTEQRVITIILINVITEGVQ